MEKTSSNNKKQTREFGALEVSRVYENQYQKKGSLTAEIKQKVKTTTTYPGISVSTDKQVNPFSSDEFENTEETVYENESTRVAWIPVPDTADQETVQKKLDDGKFYLKQVISNRPILTSQQKKAIEDGVSVNGMQRAAERQIVRAPQTADDAGLLIRDRDTGKPIYKANFLVEKTEDGSTPDEDLRTQKPEDFYLPESLKKEFNDLVEDDSVVVDQEGVQLQAQESSQDD